MSRTIKKKIKKKNGTVMGRSEDEEAPAEPQDCGVDFGRKKEL
jgi:hypothetical protein